jgi:hypothetical protein
MAGVQSQSTEFPVYMGRADAAAYIRSFGIRCTSSTLAKLAVVVGGPPFRRAGRFPVYERAHLDSWAQQRLGRLVGSTSELRGHTA